MALLSAGSRVGSYEILMLIGTGGMGEVYRARDSRLNRDVAIKVLPAAFANHPDRMARFEREAYLLASLSHPNIASIHGVEEYGGMRALVMELVDGSTLAERIRGGPLPLEEAAQIAKQIAEALEYAHERGIIHRDLKPANIKITPEGAAKILDFGLAKALEGDPGSTPPQDSPTLTLEATRAGVILGTAAYMSPEQAKGKPVDRRADIWAFGVVLYEMLTGKQLYAGDTGAEILASVMKDEPNLDQLPLGARYIVNRCLRKDPRQRWQAIGDIRIALDEAQAVEERTRADSPRQPLAWIVLSAVALLAAAILGIVYFLRAPEGQHVLKVSVLPPERAGFSGLSPPTISPDGRRLAFVATAGGRDSIWIRDLDSLVARPLPGTEDAFQPFWSPDSRSIAFFVLVGKLKKIDVAGGPAVSLCDVTDTALGGSWSRNDTILFQSNSTGSLFRVSAAGGSPAPATVLDPALGETVHSFPWFLPDGRHFLYTARGSDPEKTAVYVADLDSKSRHRVLATSSNAVYSPPGYLLFLRERTLMVQPFDAGKIQTNGDPIPIAEQVDYDSFRNYGIFSASQNGVLTYTSGAVGNLQLTWFDRSGKVIGTVGTPGVMEWPTVSPDGNIVAADRLDLKTGFFDLWLYDLKRGTVSRFTFNSKTNDSPIWSPDGSHIVFRSTRDGGSTLYQKAINGTAPDEILDKSKDYKTPNDWSRDGRYIISNLIDPKTKSDVWVLPLFGDRKPFAYLQSGFNEGFAKLSPNGHWLAYTSDETGRIEIYVQGFPDHRGKWQVSTTGGGGALAWSRDGKELFYVGADRKLMAVQVKAEGNFEFDTPKPLFDIRTLDWFDVSRDGRFLAPTPVEQSGSVPITVVINWPAALKK